MSNETQAIPWFKKAIFYEIPIKSYLDKTNNDGIGDLRGIRESLDYIDYLGVDCLWLLPFYPSPLRDDGYDISDYYSISKIYGDMKDFRTLVSGCKKRNIKIIGDFVINHTSDQHPWFKESKSSKNSPKRDWYVWSDNENKYDMVRIIFKDTEKSNWTYDEKTQQYYWHRFYSHQPDLNFDNKEVQNEILKAIDFWLELGLDGLRIDAVPYLFEREGTNCESLPETHEFIRKIRQRINQKYGMNNKILLAEANQPLEETLSYFGNGNDEFHMAFNFPLMPRLFMALARQDYRIITKIIKKTEKKPKQCQWCNFLRNHDELTLEMVSEENRQFMWNFYALEPRMRLNLGIRRRLAPLLENDQNKIKLLNSILFSLPGSPIIYYGDEIGMGDNIWLQDRDGVRTPMQWNATNNAGFSTVSSNRLYSPVIDNSEYSYRKVNVKQQMDDPNSLLHFHRKLIRIRKENPILAVGEIRFLNQENKSVFSFIRKYKEEKFLILHNLANKDTQFLIKDHNLRGSNMINLLDGKSDTIPITNPLILNLSSYDFKWFKIFS